MKEFPKKVIVTDHVIETESFSANWREKTLQLATDIKERYETSQKERFIVAIGGPSGSSKSTTAKVLEALLQEEGLNAVCVGADGYHFEHSYLEKTLDSKGVPLSEHKGRFDSFDVETLRRDMQHFIDGNDVSFPEYSRTIHNPVPNAIQTSGATLLILEGLWLMYDKEPWNSLLPMYDMTVFFTADAETRKTNTIRRHVRGHEHEPDEAEIFYENSDAQNAEKILASVAPHDVDVVVE